VVLDASQEISHEDRELIDQAVKRTAIIVANKSDLKTESLSEGCHSERSEESAVPVLLRVPTSALTGEGIVQLREAILLHVTGDAGAQSEAGFLTSARHQALVSNSLKGLAAAESAVQNQIPHEMLLLDLYGALRPLDEITGATTTDDILNLIFSTFCIGK